MKQQPHFNHVKVDIAFSIKKMLLLNLLLFGSFFFCVAQTCSTATGLAVSSVTAYTAQFDWDAMASPVTSYVLRYRVVGSPTWGNAGAASNTKYVSGLTASSNYEAQISSYCSTTGTQTAFSSSITFTTGVGCPVPTNLSTTSVTSNSVVLNWDAMSSPATSYIARYRAVGSPTWNNTSAASNTKYISGLTASTNYEAQVSTYCSSTGTQTAYTGSATFTTDIPCPLPDGLTATSVSSSTMTLHWNVLGSPATSYIIRYREVGSPTWFNSSASTNNKIITGLTASTSYEAQVSAYCSASSSQSSFTSSTNITTTNIACPSPGNIALASSSNTASVVGNICRTETQPNGSTVEYTSTTCNPILQIADQSSGSGPGSTAVCVTVLSAPPVVLSGQPYAPRYYEITPTQSESAVVTFYCTTADLVAYNAVNGSLLDMPINGSDPNFINVKIAQVTGGTLLTGTITSLTPSAVVLNSGTNRWEISITLSSPIGLFYLYTDPACNYTMTAATVSNITSSTAQFDWTAAGAGGNYEWRYRIQGSNTWTNAGAGGPSLTRVFTGLTPATIYEFQGKVRCNPQPSSGLWGSIVSFTTLTATVCPAITSLAASGVTSNKVDLNWTAAASPASSYLLQYRIVGAGSWTNAGVTSNTKTINNLIPNTNYETQVLSYCTSLGYYSSASALVSFTTDVACPIPSSLAENSVTTTQATLSWTNVSNAVSGNKYIMRYRINPSGSWTNSGCPTNSRYINGLTANTSYDVQVSSVCLDGSVTPYSSTYTFSTLSMRPSEPDPIVLVTAETTAFNLYPNPTKELLNIEINVLKSNTTMIKLYDMSGRLIKQISMHSQTGLQKYELNMSGISSGLYTLHVYENEKLTHISKVRKSE